MDEQYDIERILMNTQNRFLMQPGYEDTRPDEYQIYFQFSGRPDRFYMVSADQDSKAELWKISDHSLENDFLEGELVNNPDILAIDSPDLGKVYIKFKNQIIKEYESYDDFWEDVGH
jgi:hypothetical protein